MKSITEGNKLIDESMVKTIPKKIDDQMIIYMENFDSMRRYFDADGWSTCLNSMACKKVECTCGTCGKLISDTVVFCSKCKKWFHDGWEQATTEVLKKRRWHCR